MYLFSGSIITGELELSMRVTLAHCPELEEVPRINQQN